MDSFFAYLQPVITWLELHPYWALLFAFLVSFSESLAIIGSIVPGSVTMTAIGILAGSGIMRIDLTFIAAILGAMAGDSFSYLLGYRFRDSLITMWPFRNYPQWLTYGQNYFARHGGKSVLLGRFVGPLRSLIPVIAGMMHMPQWRFFAANVLSAIGWAMLYVLPGIAIGAASSELSPESATRLFALVLIFLASIWLLSMLLKWLFVHLNRYVSHYFHIFWIWAGQLPALKKTIHFLTPRSETNHSQTMALCLITLLLLLLTTLLVSMSLQTNLMILLNQPVHLFLQSLRTTALDSFFITAVQFISPLTLLTTLVTILLATFAYRDWHSFIYWVSLHCFSAAFLIILWLLPHNLFEASPKIPYLTLCLTFASAQFSALLLYNNRYYHGTLKTIVSSFLYSILFISACAPLYLGDLWLISILEAYAGGLTLSLFHWIFYRRKNVLHYSPKLPAFIIGIITLTALISLFFNYTQIVRVHQPYSVQYVFTENDWWHQKSALLPVYRTNRIGKPFSLFNFQYAGDLTQLETALLHSGWHTENESLFNSLLKRMNQQANVKLFPLMAQLYLNKKPVLVMTFQPDNGDSPQILRLWRSNFHLQNEQTPIWIGTVGPYFFTISPSNDTMQHSSSLFYLSKALPQFLQRFTKLQITLLSSELPYPYEPGLLLIRALPPLKIERQSVK